MTEIPFRKILGLNQQSYQRLKLCLSLNLRRQVFIAVCDDLPMRDRLAAQLQAELAKAAPEGDQAALQVGQSRLVSLQLSLEDPNPIVQIGQWLAASQPSPQAMWQQSMPAFQILGIEKLTRQSAALQRTFFTHLQSIEYNLPLLESSLVIWLTQPWFRSLPHSAPEFWRCRTAVFEFIGDPTPIVVTVPERIGVPQPQQAPSPTEDPPPVAITVPITAYNPWELLAQDLDLSHLFESEQEAAASERPAERPAEPAARPTHFLPEETTAPDAGNSRLPNTIVQEPVFQEPAAAEPARDAVVQAATLEKPAIATAVATALPAEFQSEELRQLPLVQQIEQLHQQQAPATAIAAAYCNLGNLYRDQVEQGSGSVQQMVIAIQSYEQALHHLPETEPLWVDILNDLGNLYWMLSRSMTKTEEALPYLQRGLQAYQLALTKINPQSQSHTYPMVQNNLGAAYADLARYQDPAESLRLSVEAYLQALRHRSPQTDPIRYASTQNNLGTTYWNLAQHQQPQVNLKQAIAAYSEALRFYDPAQEPLNYAMIQNNLGTAYWNLAQYDRPRDWLALSLASYRMALKYRTLETTPTAYAATQNNIGTAYWHMANHAEDAAMRVDYLKQAIAAYEATLLAAERLKQQPQPLAPLNFDIIATQNNLGLAHYQVATDTQAKLTTDQQSQHLSAALNHHLLALQAWTGMPELRQTALTRVIETLRAIYSQLGLTGQNRALSMVPGQLLPEILPRL
ncbi:tetratricopeptide repeat protein [Phormidium tenue FACHB-886]|nr:tetratricopeptide repeat protein [Phormidium tenue FACHB-886]